MEDMNLNLEPENNQKTPYNYNLIIGIILAILVLGGVAYWYFNKNSSTEDLDNTTVNEIPATETDSLTVSQDSLYMDSDNQMSQNEVDDDNTTTIDSEIQEENNQPTEDSQQTTNEELQYFIVAGAFKNPDNAQNKLSDLKNNGYEAILIEPTKEGGLYIVAYEGLSDFETAKSSLNAIRETDPQAWIYKK
jgi:cell division septation protein DedD